MKIQRKDSSNLSPAERRRVLDALLLGPWALTRFAGGPPVGEPEFPDEVLEDAWFEWAQHERTWDQTTYGHWRFVVDLEPVEAFAAVRQVRRPPS